MKGFWCWLGFHKFATYKQKGWQMGYSDVTRVEECWKCGLQRGWNIIEKCWEIIG